MKKIVFYYTHKESLGHATRVLSIVESLRSRHGRDFEITLFQAGKSQEYLRIPDGVKIFHLPNPYYSKACFKSRDHLWNSFTPKIRAEYMLEKLKNIKPDIFITEFFPLGRQEAQYELLPVLHYLSKLKTRILASAGYPYVPMDNYKSACSFINFFEKVLVHVPENTEYLYFKNNITNPYLKQLYQTYFRVNEDKMLYTGYIPPHPLHAITPAKTIRQRFGASRKILVLVSRGGGVCYPNLISHAILSLQYLPEEYVFIVVPGPSTSDAEMKVFRLLMRGRKDRCSLIKYTPDFSSLVNACDVSVNMSGYNTSVQLLHYRKNTVVIPSIISLGFSKGYCGEQVARSRLMLDHLNSVEIEYKRLSSKKIATSIKKLAMMKPKPGVPSHWFDGLKTTMKFIAG